MDPGVMSVAGNTDNPPHTLLQVVKVGKAFPVQRSFFASSARNVFAVHEVTFELRHGETLGLVGESGCGKTTLARMIARIEKPTYGQILYRGQDIFSPRSPFYKEYRRKTQFVFQDPYASLNPRLRAGEIISEPMIIHGKEAEAATTDRLLEMVGLSPDHRDRYPHEFSGGQRQRIVIARALALQPEIVIADEPVSALDVSVQAQILNLLKDLQAKFHLTYLFISHDIGVIRFMSDRVAVMYAGRIVEMGSNEEIFLSACHPYTRMLMAAVPRLVHSGAELKRDGFVSEGMTAARDGQGCAFCPRCPEAAAVCRRETPAMRIVTEGHFFACHLNNNVA